MKKLLIFVLLLASLQGYGQLTRINLGTGPGTGDGDPLRTAFIKTDTALAIINTLQLYNGVLRLPGSTSGYTTIQAEAVAGSNTLTAPAETGTLATRANVTTQVNDSLNAVRAAATLGVAKADSIFGTGGHYVTQTQLASWGGAGGGLTAKRLPFIVDVTSGAPSAADSTVTHTWFSGRHIDLYRDGAKQYQNFTATNTVEGFRISGSTITVNPVWQANEQVLVDVIEPVLWSYLSFEGEESTLLDDLSGYWKLDESSGTTVTDATGVQNGTVVGGASRVSAKLNYGVRISDEDHAVIIPYNTNITPKGSAFTVGFWIYLDSVPSETGRDAIIFLALNNQSPYTIHTIYIPTAGANADKLHFESTNTSLSDYLVLSSGALTAETWYHIVAVNRGDGQTLQLYLNGSDVSASAGTFTGTVYEALGNIGFGNGYSQNPYYAPNILDECAIWSRALTSDEVAEWYNSSIGKSHPF